MSGYEILRFAHIVGAIAWLGSGIGLLVLSLQFTAAEDHDGLLAVLRRSDALGKVLFMPAALVTVGAGVTLVATEAAFGFGDLWILIGFGGILASGVAQMAVAAPAGQRFADLAEAGGADRVGMAAAARRMNLGNALDAAVLLLVVWAMVAKPVL